MRKKRILTISDSWDNGKGGSHFIVVGDHCYIYECKIRKDSLFIRNKLYNLNITDTVIFNFNEEGASYKAGKNPNLRKFRNLTQMIDLFKAISRLIKKKYPHITIYQDPEKCFMLGDKIKTYAAIKGIKNDLFRIPKYKVIRFSEDFCGIDFFPLIIKENNASQSKKDTLCHNKDELMSAYLKHFKNESILRRVYRLFNTDDVYAFFSTPVIIRLN